jgi:hypothetical protein
MTLSKCKCGRNTDNGFLCTNCQRDGTIDTSYYEPEDEETEELDEYGFTVVDHFDEEDDD